MLPATAHMPPDRFASSPPSLRRYAGRYPDSIRVGGFGVACFLVGLTYSVKVNLLGEAALAELMLPLLGLYAVLRADGRRIFGTKVFWVLLISMLVTLSGYVISDLIRETPEAQYLRGWGRMVLVITGFVSLALVAATQRHALWWFVAGMGIGRILFLRIMAGEPISMWKFSHDGFGYAEPLTLAAAAIAYFLPPRLASLILATIGAISIYYDFRIQSLVCTIVAGFIWIRASTPGTAGKSNSGALRLAMLFGAATLLIYAGIKLTESDYSASRRDASDIGRSVGKIFAMKAISNSPLIGYGSWSRNREFMRMHEEALKEVAGKEAGQFRVANESSVTHAMLLQAWVEGGVLAIVFFGVLGYYLLKCLPHLLMRRKMDALSPILAYFSIYGLWHIVMSPFAAPLRLHLALAAASIVYLALERMPVRRQGGMKPLDIATSAAR